MEIAARLNPGESLGDRILKVNHAGENGAVNIYRGQLVGARFRASAQLGELREFQSHEERHRAIFWAELQRRGRPRCRSYLVCGAGGYLLGLITGLAGSSAIAATTVAVERVVLRHLEAQLEQLAKIDPEAHSAISEIVREEREHHDRALESRQGGFWPRILLPAVSASTEAVIWLGMKL